MQAVNEYIRLVGKLMENPNRTQDQVEKALGNSIVLLKSCLESNELLLKVVGEYAAMYKNAEKTKSGMHYFNKVVEGAMMAGGALFVIHMWGS